MQGELVTVGKFDWEKILFRYVIKGGSATKLVALTLSTYASDNGRDAKPGRDRLAADTNLSTRTVSTALETLERIGLVTRLSRGNEFGRGGRGNSAEYVLTAPQDVAAERAEDKARKAQKMPPIDRPRIEAADILNRCPYPTLDERTEAEQGNPASPIPEEQGKSVQEWGKSATGTGEAHFHIPTIDQPATNHVESAADATRPEPSQEVAVIQGELVPAEEPKRSNKSPEHLATDDAYEKTGKAFNFIATRGIAKWLIHDRGLTPERASDAIVAVYQMGKPITKQVLGQLIDGHLRGNAPAQSDNRIHDTLAAGDRLQAMLDQQRKAS